MYYRVHFVPPTNDLNDRGYLQDHDQPSFVTDIVEPWRREHEGCVLVYRLSDLPSLFQLQRSFAYTIFLIPFYLQAVHVH
jgi:hypothetical protein